MVGILVPYSDSMERSSLRAVLRMASVWVENEDSANKKFGGFDALQELSTQSKKHRDNLSDKAQNSDA